ncbi:MAG: prenyltransferase/squalene oxidase repeat-containing protein [Planctomycetota bacterium]|nr:prenyltransferase/squalene oxidase repeat-containing protein [Planctomycetota bacterium]
MIEKKAHMRRKKRNILIPMVVTVLIIAPWRDGGNPTVPQPNHAQAAPSPALPKMMTTETVKSIDKGLEYLRRTQRTDGSWFSGYGYYEYPAVMTSLSGLAFMASGSTPETGLYYKQVKKAMFYVLRLAEGGKDGLICGPTGESRSMYGHGFSMLFLAQCYGMDLDKETSERIRRVLDKAVALTARAQSSQGGWIYTPTQNADEGSVTVTQLQALRACRNVGIKVPAGTITRAVEYLKKCQMDDGGICYSLRSRGSSRPAISAAAIACFYAAGIYDRRSGGSGEEAQMVEKLVTYCKRNLDVNRDGVHYFYTHFYMAQAMYQRGRADWKNYYPQIRDRLMKLQNVDGSWMGDNVGTTYGTALATVILQLPYGYLPICQK